MVGEIQVFETFEGAVYGALADVGVLRGDLGDDLLGAPMALSLYESSDNATQGNGRAPSGLADGPDSGIDSGLTRHCPVRPATSHRRHLLVDTGQQQWPDLSRRAGRFRAVR